jgi:hypothetical protein
MPWEDTEHALDYCHYFWQGNNSLQAVVFLVVMYHHFLYHHFLVELAARFPGKDATNDETEPKYVGLTCV